MGVISTPAFLGKLCIYHRGSWRGGGERGASHSILFPAESKDPLCLVCRQLLLRGEFLLRIPVCLRVQALTVRPRRAGWGLQGITKDAKDAASPTCSTEHIRSQGQAPTSFGSPLLPSQDDTRIQLRRNSGIKLKVLGKAEKG